MSLFLVFPLETLAEMNRFRFKEILADALPK